MTTLSALERDQMLGKIVILYPAQGSPNGNSENTNVFSMPRLAVDGLFLAGKLPRGLPKKLAPLSTSSYSSVTSNGGLISPQSPARPSGRPIDPSLVNHLHDLQAFGWTTDVAMDFQPLHKRPCIYFLVHIVLILRPSLLENPPPCNEFYLMTCSKGVRSFE